MVTIKIVLIRKEVKVRQRERRGQRERGRKRMCVLEGIAQCLGGRKRRNCEVDEKT